MAENSSASTEWSSAQFTDSAPAAKPNSKYRMKCILFNLLGAVVIVGAVGIIIFFSRVTETTNTAFPVWAAGRLSANVTRSEHGVAHIRADSLQELAFGSGFAQAEDNVCIIADVIVKARSERSKFFGPGAGSANLVSDFGYLAMRVYDDATKWREVYSPESQALISGFVAGYNKFLATKDILDPYCAGKPWVRNISETDLVAYMYAFMMMPGADNLRDLMFAVAPDGDYIPRPVVRGGADALAGPLDIHLKSEIGRSAGASNGWALGPEMSRDGKGMVLGNPHFPHTGNLRFWEHHAVIPGHLDVYGASLVGVPGVVNIGFNEDVAWTHTFSQASHMIVWQLELKCPGDPTCRTAKVDGRDLPIEERTVSIQMLTTAGVVEVEKTLYFTEMGPLVDVGPLLQGEAVGQPWGTHVYVVEDVNRANSDSLDMWLAFNRASDMGEFQDAFNTSLSTPLFSSRGAAFLNTIAVDKEGMTFFIDASPVPQLTELARETIIEPLYATIRANLGVTVLPLSTEQMRSSGWDPISAAPSLVGRPYVQNGNDTHWLTNPDAPLEGYNPLFGPEAYPQSMRTRLGLSVLRAAQTAAEPGFSLDELESAIFNSYPFLADLVLSDLREQCQATAHVVVSGETVDLSEACRSLDGFEESAALSALRSPDKGGVVFREFASFFDYSLLSEQFDLRDPVGTPRTLTRDGRALLALGAAVKSLTDAGLSPAANLSDYQFVELSDAHGAASGPRLPWQGSTHIEGGFNVFSGSLDGDGTLIPQHRYPRVQGVAVEELGVQAKPLASRLTTEGYHVRNGSSWMMVVEFNDHGVSARGTLTYSQSGNTSAYNSRDQTELYSEEPKLRPISLSFPDAPPTVIDE